MSKVIQLKHYYLMLRVALSAWYWIKFSQSLCISILFFYYKHLQALLQKRKKTHNIMMNFLGTSAMIIQTILKESKNFIYIPPPSIAEQNIWDAPGGHRHNHCIFNLDCVHHMIRLAWGLVI